MNNEPLTKIYYYVFRVLTTTQLFALTSEIFNLKTRQNKLLKSVIHYNFNKNQNSENSKLSR